jgi:SAM-dependent methyltransferase
MKNEISNNIFLSGGKEILDACCGGKMFWFDKADPKVLFQDRRKVNPITVGKGKNARQFECSPDVIADFRDMPYPNNHFKLVVFDPPHFTSLGEKSYMAVKYGRLNKDTWRDDITKGFSECFRVLKKGGILIFKWNEHDIRLSEILKLTSHRPLFGHPSGKTQKTHWVCFMKHGEEKNIITE